MVKGERKLVSYSPARQKLKLLTPPRPFFARYSTGTKRHRYSAGFNCLTCGCVRYHGKEQSTRKVMCQTEYVATRVQVHPRQLTFTTLPLIVNAETPTCQCCSGDQRAVTMVSLHMSTQRKSSIGTIQPLRIPLHFILVGGFNPSEKYESQLGFLFPRYGKIKNVPNHQPVLVIPQTHMLHIS